MLRSVLQAIESAHGPVHVAALSQQLGIDRAALEGMISYWVQKGRLQDLDAVASCDDRHNHGHCGSGCGGGGCNFVARMPKSYTIHLSESSNSRS